MQNHKLKPNQTGAVSGLLVLCILTVLLLLGAIGFGVWAYGQSQHYKTDVDAIVAKAEEAAKTKTAADKDKQFAEEAKNPLKIYNGPEAFGSMQLHFPKTWSGYVDTGNGASNGGLAGYFAPGTVPSIGDQNNAFALRLEVVKQPYAQVLQSFNSQQQGGKISVNVYALPKLPKVVGVKVTGEITQGKTATMVVLPLRSDTLKIWTEGTQFVSDFNNNILPNFSFSP